MRMSPLAPSSSWPSGGRSLRPRAAIACVVALILLACAGPGVSMAHADDNEFAQPSWTALPAPNAYNFTPSCPVSVGDPTCDVPESAWPAPDPNNLMWHTHTKNADGTWATDMTGYINSAYWPFEKRPDMWTYADTKFHNGDYEDCGARSTHYCFLAYAQGTGYPITHTPAVGDLMVAPGECFLWAYTVDEQEDANCDPASNMDWYIGYVEQVLPDGSFIISWGGSDTPADSGIELVLLSGNMAPDAEFIGLMPPGSPPPGGWSANPTSVTASVSAGHASINANSAAPNAVLTVTGAKTITRPLSNGALSLRLKLTSGRWSACVTSGGLPTSYTQKTACRTFTVRPALPSPKLRIATRFSASAGMLTVTVTGTADLTRKGAVQMVVVDNATDMRAPALHGRGARQTFRIAASGTWTVAVSFKPHRGAKIAGQYLQRSVTLRLR